MAQSPPRDHVTREELARRADAAYEKYVQPNLTLAEEGKFVASLQPRPERPGWMWLFEVRPAPSAELAPLLILDSQAR
jgi:hypothetical protein